MLNLFLLGELFSQGVCFGVFALLDEPFKDLLVLEQLGRLLEAERLVQLSLVVLAQLDQLGHMRLLQGFQIGLA